MKRDDVVPMATVVVAFAVSWMRRRTWYSAILATLDNTTITGSS
jgi:hypothetical protein